MDRVLILAARRYSFKDETSGRLVEGTTVNYVTGDAQESADSRGLATLTISGPLDVMASLRDLPGVYEVDFKQRPGKNGRPQLQLVGVQFVRALDVASALNGTGEEAGHGASANGRSRGPLLASGA